MAKTILITGASSGLGKLTAKHFARQGFIHKIGVLEVSWSGWEGRRPLRCDFDR